MSSHAANTSLWHQVSQGLFFSSFGVLGRSFIRIRCLLHSIFEKLGCPTKDASPLGDFLRKHWNLDIAGAIPTVSIGRIFFSVNAFHCTGSWTVGSSRESVVRISGDQVGGHSDFFASRVTNYGSWQKTYRLLLSCLYFCGILFLVSFCISSSSALWVGRKSFGCTKVTFWLKSREW